MNRTFQIFLFAVVSVLILTPAGFSDQASSQKNSFLPDVGIDQKIGDQLPLDLVFTNEAGEKVKLSSFFKGKPVIITPVYYSCPMLCSLILNGVLQTLKELSFTAGKDFEVVTFSFKPEDTAAIAAAKKETYLNSYGRPEARDGWHFLTADAETIGKMTKALGFRYEYDKVSGEYAHGAALMVATPEGKLSHYFSGVRFAPVDIRLSLVEASKNRLGSILDMAILLCYHYDPAVGKYGFAIMNALRLTGIVTITLMIGFITTSLRKEKQMRVHR